MYGMGRETWELPRYFAFPSALARAKAEPDEPEDFCLLCFE